MGGLVELVGLSAAMGLSMYLSLPVVLAKSNASRTITLLNAAAVGVLLFLLADIFADAATLIYTNPGSPYLADPARTVYFAGAVAGCFGLLYFLAHRSGARPLTPTRTAVIVAGAIGLQNLTEGLVFGAAWAVGAVGLSSVVFVGFFLQNITEGFPITSPLIGRADRRLGTIAAVFLLGGVPTIVGAVGGFYYNTPTLDVVFEALAIGAILYALLPMLRIALRPAEVAGPDTVRQRLVYVGLLAGFLAGFLVNAV